MIFIATKTETYILNEAQVSLVEHDKPHNAILIKFANDGECEITHVEDMLVSQGMPIDWNEPGGRYDQMQKQINSLQQELSKMNDIRYLIIEQRDVLSNAVSHAICNLEKILSQIDSGKEDGVIAKGAIALLIRELKEKEDKSKHLLNSK